MTALILIFALILPMVGAAAPKASAPKALASAPSFELCFEGSHGRCFRTERAGMFRQYGGLSDSEAFLPESEQRRLHKEISSFFSKVGYAKSAKVKSCTKPFVFRQIEKIPSSDSIRCLERLKKADSSQLLSLITQISLASKPL